jgi:hypothetical protein
LQSNLGCPTLFWALARNASMRVIKHGMQTDGLRPNTPPSLSAGRKKFNLLQGKKFERRKKKVLESAFAKIQARKL